MKKNIDENAVIEFKWYSVTFLKGAPQGDLLLVGWHDRHILRSEIACYVYLMNLSSSFLCFRLYQISLWDFITLVLSSSVDRGLFSFDSQKTFVREVIPIWQMEICGSARWHGVWQRRTWWPPVSWPGLLQALIILCVSQRSVAHTLRNHKSGTWTSIFLWYLNWVRISLE